MRVGINGTYDKHLFTCWIRFKLRMADTIAMPPSAPCPPSLPSRCRALVLFRFSFIFGFLAQGMMSLTCLQLALCPLCLFAIVAALTLVPHALVSMPSGSHDAVGACLAAMHDRMQPGDIYIYIYIFMLYIICMCIMYLIYIYIFIYMYILHIYLLFLDDKTIIFSYYKV
jgi:hypothetical protein